MEVITQEIDSDNAPSGSKLEGEKNYKKKKKNGNKKTDRTAGKPVPDVIAVVNAVAN